VIVLYQGQVMESGPIRNIASDPAHPYTRALHSASPLPDPRAQRARRALVDQAPPGETTLGSPGSSAACPFAPRCPYARPRCWSERPQLRTAERDGLVACHRYPEWRQEARASTTRARDETTPDASATDVVSMARDQNGEDRSRQSEAAAEPRSVTLRSTISAIPTVPVARAASGRSGRSPTVDIVVGEFNLLGEEGTRTPGG
jgi:oligopeptide/dipeptide ABC transporter ATP-binding protein